MDVTFKYDDGSAIYSKSIEALALRGLTEPDDIEVNGVVHAHLDGSKAEQNNGFKKEITIVVSPRADATERRFLVDFIASTQKLILYGDYTSEVVNVNETLVSDWLNSIELGRAFTMQVFDSHVYRAWTSNPVLDEIMYLKRGVKIEGTEPSPETFTTNSGKLATDETGQAYPAFSDSTHVFQVDINAGPNCQATFAVVKGSIAIVGGNLTFQAFVSDQGRGDPNDGFFYTSIAISLQAKP